MAKKEADFLKWLGPLLEGLRELGGSGRPREVSALIAARNNLSPKQLAETTKSGQARFHNQVAWARQYLVWEGLIDGSRSLSDLGRRKRKSTPARTVFAGFAGP